MSALTPKLFESSVWDAGAFKSDWSQDYIKNEPQFFNASLEFAYANGKGITREFIAALPRGWESSVLDSRVHMLMNGWYPAIPGYHHDDVPRPPIPVGQHFLTAPQPDYENPRYKAEHIMGLVSGDICPTAFALGECLMPAIPEDGLIYRRWHMEIVQMLAAGKLEHWSAPSGRLIGFDWQTFHTGVKASGSGWRWFCRITRNSDRCATITNEQRTQTQVYLEFPMEGW